MYDVKQFKPALYALVLLGISGFAMASASGGMWVAAVVLILLNMAWVSGGYFRPLPRMLANLLVVAAAAYVVFRITGEGTPVLIVGQFLVALQVIKLYEQRANRDYGQLIVLSLLLMVAAAISTTSIVFGLVLVVYLFLSLYCCLLFHLKVETDRARQQMGLSDQRPGDVRQLRQDQRRLGSSMRRLTVLVSLVSVTFAVIVFLAFPRGSGALVGRDRAAFRSNEAVTGFSGQVSFQDIARITQNTTPVAYVQVFRNGSRVAGTETLYLRGSTLDMYVSDPNAVDRWTWRKASQEYITILRSTDSYGPVVKLGAPQELPPVILEQVFELEPVGLDVLPSLAGTFMISSGPQGFRYSQTDGTIQVPVPLRRPVQYTTWSTGSINDPLSTPADLPGASAGWIQGDLMRLRSLHDRMDLMRQASLGKLQLAGRSPRDRAAELLSRSGLLMPRSDLEELGRVVTSLDEVGAEHTQESFTRQIDRIHRNAPYPAPAEIIRFAMDPAVSGTDDEGRSLAEQRLQRTGTTELDEQIARNISRFLQTQYRFTLDITDARMSGDQDPLAWFVSEDGRRGHCEYFAGAAALACQALGIPARVVVGFKTDEYNKSLEKYVVRQSDAHAWIEVLTERGWLRLDPTSGNGDDLTRTGTSFLDTITHWFEFLEYTWANSIVNYDNGARTTLMETLETDVITRAQETAGLWDRFKAWLERQNLYIYSAQLVAWLIVAMVVAAAAILFWYFFEQWRLRRRARRIGLRGIPRDEALRLARQLAFFDELLRLLERRGYRRQPSQTPREFAQSLAFLPRRAYDAVNSLTEVFYRVRYGGAALTARRQRLLSRSLDDLSAALPRS